MSETKYICPDADLEKLMDYPECFMRCFEEDKSNLLYSEFDDLDHFNDDDNYQKSVSFYVGENDCTIIYDKDGDEYIFLRKNKQINHISTIEDVHEYMTRLLEPKLIFYGRGGSDKYTADDLRDGILTKAATVDHSVA